MKKFLIELTVALVILLIGIITTFRLVSATWFWWIFWSAIILVLFYISYRFSRLWIKQCQTCGSLNIVIKKKKRRPDHFVPIGMKLDCDNIKVCHNVTCRKYLQEQEYSSYVKVFDPIEVLWRKFWGEDFPR